MRDPRCLLLALEYSGNRIREGASRDARNGEAGLVEGVGTSRIMFITWRVRRNSKFVSLSAIIFSNLHTNRSRSLYTHGAEGGGWRAGVSR